MKRRDPTEQTRLEFRRLDRGKYCIEAVVRRDQHPILAPPRGYPRRTSKRHSARHESHAQVTFPHRAAGSECGINRAPHFPGLVRAISTVYACRLSKLLGNGSVIVASNAGKDML